MRNLFALLLISSASFAGIGPSGGGTEIVANSCSASQFANAISDDGTLTCAAPAAPTAVTLMCNITSGSANLSIAGGGADEVVDYNNCTINTGSIITVTTGASWKATIGTGGDGTYEVCITEWGLSVWDAVPRYWYTKAFKNTSEGPRLTSVTATNTDGAGYYLGKTGCALFSLVATDYIQIKMANFNNNAITLDDAATPMNNRIMITKQ